MIEMKELVWIKIKGKYYKNTLTQSIDVTKDGIAYVTKKKLSTDLGYVELISKDTIAVPIEEAELFYIQK